MGVLASYLTVYSSLLDLYMYTGITMELFKCTSTCTCTCQGAATLVIVGSKQSDCFQGVQCLCDCGAARDSELEDYLLY